MPDIPILGQANAVNGQPVQALPQEYVGEIVTADGVTHRHVFNFGAPVLPDGSPDLAALRSIDPRKQFNANMTLAVQNAHRTATGTALDVEGGGQACLLHVVSWRYLGTIQQVAGFDEMNAWLDDTLDGIAQSSEQQS